MRTNFVLIDAENVKPDYIEKLKHEHFRVVVFIGAKVKWLDFPTVDAIHSLGSNASYVRISSSGPNALDFHIAYYIGKLSATNPGSPFYIVSKDKGYDPLIQHLKTQKISCSRLPSVLEIPSIKSANKLTSKVGAAPVLKKLSAKERAAEVYKKRIASTKARPATVTSLQSTILSHFNKLISEKEVADVQQALTEAGHIVVNGKKIAYPDRG